MYNPCCFCKLRTGCMIIGVITVLWWSGVLIACSFYSGLESEKDSFDTFSGLKEQNSTLFQYMPFYDEPYGFYLTVKLAVCFSLAMIFAGFTLFFAAACSLKCPCLIYPILAEGCCVVQIVYLIQFEEYKLLPVFWMVLEFYFSMCALFLFHYTNNTVNSAAETYNDVSDQNTATSDYLSDTSDGYTDASSDNHNNPIIVIPRHGERKVSASTETDNENRRHHGKGDRRKHRHHHHKKKGHHRHHHRKK